MSIIPVIKAPKPVGHTIPYPFRINRHSEQADGLHFWWPAHHKDTSTVAQRDYTDRAGYSVALNTFAEPALVGSGADYLDGTDKPVEFGSGYHWCFGTGGAQHAGFRWPDFSMFIDEVTISMWVHQNGTGSASTLGNFLYCPDAGTIRLSAHVPYLSRRLRFYCGTAILSAGERYTSQDYRHDWNHWVFQSGFPKDNPTNRQVRIYRNGILHDDTTDASTNGTITNLHLGRWLSNTYRAQGCLFDVRIYTKFKEIEQIRRMYQLPTRYELFQPAVVFPKPMAVVPPPEIIGGGVNASIGSSSIQVIENLAATATATTEVTASGSNAVLVDLDVTGTTNVVSNGSNVVTLATSVTTQTVTNFSYTVAKGLAVTVNSDSDILSGSGVTKELTLTSNSQVDVLSSASNRFDIGLTSDSQTVIDTVPSLRIEIGLLVNGQTSVVTDATALCSFALDSNAVTTVVISNSNIANLSLTSTSQTELSTAATKRLTFDLISDAQTEIQSLSSVRKEITLSSSAESQVNVSPTVRLTFDLVSTSQTSVVTDSILYSLFELTSTSQTSVDSIPNAIRKLESDSSSGTEISAVPYSVRKPIELSSTSQTELNTNPSLRADFVTTSDSETSLIVSPSRQCNIEPNSDSQTVVTTVVDGVVELSVDPIIVTSSVISESSIYSSFALASNSQSEVAILQSQRVVGFSLSSDSATSVEVTSDSQIKTLNLISSTTTNVDFNFSLRKQLQLNVVNGTSRVSGIDYGVLRSLSNISSSNETSVQPQTGNRIRTFSANSFNQSDIPQVDGCLIRQNQVESIDSETSVSLLGSVFVSFSPVSSSETFVTAASQTTKGLSATSSTSTEIVSIACQDATGSVSVDIESRVRVVLSVRSDWNAIVFSSSPVRTSVTKIGQVNDSVS